MAGERQPGRRRRAGDTALLAESIRAAIASSGHDQPRYYNLRPLAEAADLDQRELVAASRRGDFAPVLRISQRVYLVRADDLASWERRAIISPSTAQENTDRDRIEPVEPFAHLSTSAPPPQRGRAHTRTRTTVPPSTVAASPEAGRG
jgi:hypothetical protein